MRKAALTNGHHGGEKHRIVNEAPLDVERKDFSLLWWLVGPVVFLYMSGYMTASVTFTQYLYRRAQKDLFPSMTFNSSKALCDVNTSDPDYQAQTKAQEHASEWIAYYAIFGGVPAVFSNVILGCYTDKFGRKFLFFIACLGTFIRIAVSLAGMYWDFELIYFGIGYLCEGLTGSLFTLFLAAFTFIADSTLPGKQRTFGIVMIELSIGLGMAGMSFASGFFIEASGFLYPMVTSAAFIVIASICLIVLPETYGRGKRRQTVYRFENLKDAYDLFLGAKNRGQRWRYNVPLAVFFFTMFTVCGRMTVETLYQMDDPLCWDPKKIGWYGALRSGAQQLVGMALVKVFQYKMSDEGIAALGCVSFLGAFVLEGLARSALPIYLVAVVGACGLLTIPMIRSILSKMTPPDKQGAVFASISGIEALCNLVSSVASNAIYAGTVSFYKGFIFFVFALCNAASLALIGLLVWGTRRIKFEYEIIT